MCGIWASVGIAADRAVLIPIEHRGPDGEGWAVLDTDLGPVRIGHRRLAIIDLSETGAQPMTCHGGRYHITYNGEIYNFRALRLELETSGYRFKGHSDTEVLLCAYMAWGAACLPKLNGMFAFAIWDSEKKELFAARDRFGVKPLYLHRFRGGIALASEMKQILALDRVAAAAHAEGIERFLLVGRQSAHGPTMFQGIENLPPGHFLRYRHRDDSLRLERWYDISERLAGEAKTEAEFLNHFPDLFREAVQLRLESDVDVGALLSGGLDSSSIVAFTAQEFRKTGEARDFVTFTSWAQDESVDERKFSRAVVRRYGVRNVEAEIRDVKFAEDKDSLLMHQEEPFFGTSVYAQWNVFDSVRRHTNLKVVLDGQGSDEMLVGYYYMLPRYLTELVRKGRWLRAVWEGHALTQRHARVSPRTLVLDCLNHLGPGALAVGRKVFGRRDRGEELLGPKLAARRRNTAREPGTFQDYQRGLLESTIYPQMQWQDRNAMAFGIEARHPFLDYRLVELMLMVDPFAKVQNGRMKVLLRKAMAPHLPDEVTARDEKFGFPSPHRRLIGGMLRESILAGAARGVEALADNLNAKEALRRLAEFGATGDHGEEAWSLYNFDRWRTLFRVSM